MRVTMALAKNQKLSCSRPKGFGHSTFTPRPATTRQFDKLLYVALIFGAALLGGKNSRSITYATLVKFVAAGCCEKNPRTS